jgi:hypothetical protein
MSLSRFRSTENAGNRRAFSNAGVSHSEEG